MRSESSVSCLRQVANKLVVFLWREMVFFSIVFLVERVNASERRRTIPFRSYSDI
jgi:hypothetical protein